MRKKEILLFIAGILLLAGFFLLPANKQWARDRILTYYRDFHSQRKAPDIESRMRRRFGNEYILSKQIAAQVKKKGGSEDDLILMPPPSYFAAKRVNYYTPEPAVFYYYTGAKTTWSHFNDAINCSWFVKAEEGKLVVEKITNRQILEDTINSLKKWKKPYD